MPELAPGLFYFPEHLSAEAQAELRDNVRDVVRLAPLFQPTMPRTGTPFSVRMTNAGSLGWVSDQRSGYRYQTTHPETGDHWPDIPEIALKAWDELGHYPAPPEACLINFYNAQAKMGLHQDRDEADLDAPVVSLSLGDTAVFRWGGTTRGGKTFSLKLHSGDALVLSGSARLAFHGIDRLVPGSSSLLAQGGRLNLTLRRVTTVPK